MKIPHRKLCAKCLKKIRKAQAKAMREWRKGRMATVENKNAKSKQNKKRDNEKKTKNRVETCSS